MKTDGEIIVGTKVNTQGIEQGVADIERITENLDDIEIDVSNKDIVQGLIDTLDELYSQYKELTSGPVLLESDLQQAENIKIQINEIVDKIEELSGEKIIIKGITDVDKTLPSINSKLNTMGKSLDNVGKKVGRIGLSMLGIRSLYGMISSSVSRVSQNNQEIQQGIQAINNVLDSIIGRLLQALLPFINILVSAVETLAKLLFGIDTSSNNFNNNMKNANKSTSKLRKQLMGFDEMNILNEDGSIGALGGTGTGGNEKDYGIYNDMSGLNKGLADLGYVAVYTGDDLKETRLQLEQLIADVKLGNATMSEKNGIVTIMNKAGNSIQFTKQEYEKLLDDINHSRVTSRNLDIWWRVKDAFQGWNIKSFKKYMGKAVDIANNGSKSMQKEINQAKENFVKNLDGATYSFKDGIYEITMTNGEVVRLTKEQWAELQPYMKYVGLNIESNVNNTGGKIQAKSNETKNKVVADAKETRDEVVGYINEISGASDQSGTNIQEGAQGVAQGVISSSQQGVNNIENEYSKLPKWMQDNVFVQLLKDFGVLGDGTGQTFGKGLKDAINKVLDKIETTINNVFITANNMFKKFGINMTAPKIKLPRLAKGGIVNKVGSGVPVGSAIVGERGREAVVPLTDTQQMEYLGREIAKHIVVNLTNVTELDGRQIARSVSQVMSDMNFAGNGGVI